ncbi:MAG: hypothetical protein IPO08_22565 [Xanthomonadales bacterium]|nr:hypothetical protein [Xanthomonadales bacterium]
MPLTANELAALAENDANARANQLENEWHGGKASDAWATGSSTISSNAGSGDIGSDGGHQDISNPY